MQPSGTTWARYLSWRDSSEVADVKMRGPGSHVHRKRVLEALVSVLPTNVQTHFSSRIVGVSNIAAAAGREGYVRLEIATAKLDHNLQAEAQEQVWTFEADAVIGADGVKSVVRQLIDVNARVRWTGISLYRAMLPMERVKQVNGDFPTAAVWIGPGKVMAFLDSCSVHMHYSQTHQMAGCDCVPCRARHVSERECDRVP
jgi:2-polyprenyl-6-methoxyphenol hydroxylase-like FAD-dependent oxidoreductase